MVIIWLMMVVIWLVVSTYPSEKYEFVSWGYYSQLNGTIKAMFQTTNQDILYIFVVISKHFFVQNNPKNH